QKQQEKERHQCARDVADGRHASCYDLQQKSSQCPVPDLLIPHKMLRSRSCRSEARAPSWGRKFESAPEAPAKGVMREYGLEDSPDAAYSPAISNGGSKASSGTPYWSLSRSYSAFIMSISSR